MNNKKNKKIILIALALAFTSITFAAVCDWVYYKNCTSCGPTGETHTNNQGECCDLGRHYVACNISPEYHGCVE